ARRDLIDVHAVGLLALETEHHGDVGAVALAGVAERSVETDPNNRDIGPDARLLDALAETARGAHGPDGVGAGRPDADLEQVERADERHALTVAGPRDRRAGPVRVCSRRRKPRLLRVSRRGRGARGRRR